MPQYSRLYVHTARGDALRHAPPENLQWDGIGEAPGERAGKYRGIKAAGPAPASMSASSFQGVRFQTRTANPAASKRLAMGVPTRPVPMNAIVARLPVIGDFMWGSDAAAVRGGAVENSRDFLEH